MNTDDLWQVFSMSGKVEDYLSFKNSVENQEKRDAYKHKGNNSERTEYRRGFAGYRDAAPGWDQLAATDSQQASI